MTYIKVDVIKANLTKTVAIAGHDDDAGRLACQDFVYNEVRQQKVAEVVSSKMHFHAVRRQTKRMGHDPRAVRDHVDMLGIIPGVDLCRGLADGFKAGKVDNELPRGDVGVLRSDCLQLLVKLGLAAAGEDEQSWRESSNSLNIGSSD